MLRLSIRGERRPSEGSALYLAKEMLKVSKRVA
jgi:hypothetical protein